MFPGWQKYNVEETIIEARNMSENFGSVELFRNISVKVQAGSPIAILGPIGTADILSRSLKRVSEVPASNY